MGETAVDAAVRRLGAVLDELSEARTALGGGEGLARGDAELVSEVEEILLHAVQQTRRTRGYLKVFGEREVV